MALSSTTPTEALGQSEIFLDFQERLSRVAPVDRPVLLVGERGTGKELAAHRLHFLSRRWERPFVTLNCSTLAPTLIESELFGHERGAYTGADTARIGRFEAANGGTLFLDEIGTIPMQAQEKILRVVEYGVFERVGSSRPVEVDVRIVCATNADLVGLAQHGEFKRDLLDRLSFEVVFLPPLRRRNEDIMLLGRHFAARMAYELGLDDEISFSARAIAALEDYDWPGNVRELKNVIERAVYRADGCRVDEIVFNPFVAPWQLMGPAVEPVSGRDAGGEYQPAVSGGDLKAAVADYELRLLKSALAENRYHQGRTAESLGLSYDQLRGLMRKHRDALADGTG